MIKVLIAEDAPGVAESIAAALRVEYQRGVGEDVAKRNPMEFFIVRGLAELHQHRNDPMDVILLDLRLPPHTEHDTLSWLDEHAEEIPPVIAISALAYADNGSGWELPAVRNGALNFWHKDELQTHHGAARLFAKIKTAMAIASRRGAVMKRLLHAA